jgi:redox-sensitive bicupin YhaK (pirin superfamily)
MSDMATHRGVKAVPSLARTVKTVLGMPYHGFDEHSGAFMLHPRDAHLLDPFIGIDAYTMPLPFFPPHPHAGMSAVTVMLEDSDDYEHGGFINRDSLGDHSHIRPGDLHWTQAGAGMMHDEVPAVPGAAARGLQVFVNLAAAHKQAPPAAFHVHREDMPTVERDGARVRVIAGEVGLHGETLRSPIAADPRWLTRGDVVDVQLAPGASVALNVAAGKRAFFVLRRGELLIDGQSLAVQPTPGSADSHMAAIVFNDSQVDASIALQAGAAAVQGVLFSGVPLGEPLYPKGPFMGNTAHDIAQYIARFQRGEMGHLERA